MTKSVLAQIQDDVKSMSVRLEQTEAQLQAFSVLDRILAEFRGGMEATAKTVDALIAELDETIVQDGDKLNDRVRRRIRAQIEAAMKIRQDSNTKLLQDLVEKGALVLTDSVTDESYVVADFNVPQGDGSTIQDRVQMNFKGYNQSVRELLLGKKVGDKTGLPDGGGFEIVGIYMLQKVQPTQLSESM